MGWFNHDREQSRYYLLPGQGGRGSRRKRKQIVCASLAVGLMVAVTVGFFIWWLDNRR